MTIKPIDYHLSFNRTIYESKEKQNDFNRIKDTNTFLQNHEKNQIDRNRKKIQQSEQMEGKKVSRDNRENEKNRKKKHNSKKSFGDSKAVDSETTKKEGAKGQKLDIFI